MPTTYRGKAQVNGSTIEVDVILYPISQELDLTHHFNEEIIQGETGDDYSWRAWNEKFEGDLGMVLVDQSVSSTAANAAAGAAFLAPLAILTISTCKVAAWNTTYQLVSGSSIKLKNTDTGRMTYKLRRYADSAQNALAASTPG